MRAGGRAGGRGAPAAPPPPLASSSASLLAWPAVWALSASLSLTCACSILLARLYLVTTRATSAGEMPASVRDVLSSLGSAPAQGRPWALLARDACSCCWWRWVGSGVAKRVLALVVGAWLGAPAAAAGEGVW
jgi:hypothetical protein